MPLPCSQQLEEVSINAAPLSSAKHLHTHAPACSRCSGVLASQCKQAAHVVGRAETLQGHTLRRFRGDSMLLTSTPGSSLPQFSHRRVRPVEPAMPPATCGLSSMSQGPASTSCQCSTSVRSLDSVGHSSEWPSATSPKSSVAAQDGGVSEHQPIKHCHVLCTGIGTICAVRGLATASFSPSLKRPSVAMCALNGVQQAAPWIPKQD